MKLRTFTEILVFFSVLRLVLETHKSVVKYTEFILLGYDDDTAFSDKHDKMKRFKAIDKFIWLKKQNRASLFMDERNRWVYSKFGNVASCKITFSAP